MNVDQEREGGFIRDEQYEEEEDDELEHPQDIEAELDEGIALATATRNAIVYNSGGRRNLLIAYCRLIEFLQDFTPNLKAWHYQLKRQKLSSIGWKKFMPQFLYQNGILTVHITGNEMRTYKTIKRWIDTDTQRVKELWMLDKRRILPCDEMAGPYISDISQMYSANEFIKLLTANPRFDADKTVAENFAANPSFYYFYRNDLTFYHHLEPV